jgi:hypothetical protein
MLEDMQLRGLAHLTQEAYLSAVQQLALHYGTSPDLITEDQLRQYFLFLCNDKALSKKILRFHRVRTPRFHTFYRGHKVWLPKTLKLPCIIKPLTEEASRGISQASIVDDEASFLARIEMIHERMNLDAIAEEYIDGRELYVSIIGDRALRILPAREMTFGQKEVGPGPPGIARLDLKRDALEGGRRFSPMASAELDHGPDPQGVDGLRRRGQPHDHRQNTDRGDEKMLVLHIVTP